MGYSIQEIIKKINSSVSWADCISLLYTACILAVFALYLYNKTTSARLPVLYKEYSGNFSLESGDSYPFGSRSGTTYTFSWCSGSANIQEKNKVYFKTAELAENAGRSLSKLCQK